MAVLFADLAGYTALAGSSTPRSCTPCSSASSPRRPHRRGASAARIDKHIGDCVMAVFGAPVAHGNDAERAVARRARHPRRDAGAQRASRPPIAVHIGVAGGQVVRAAPAAPAHRDYTVTGDSVNLASRLTDAAPRGEILVSDAVRRAARRAPGVRRGRRARGQGLRRARPRLAAARAAAPRRGRAPAVRRPARASCAQFEAALGACRDAGARAGALRARRGRHRQDAAGRGVPARWRRAAASPAMPGSCSTSAPAPAATRSARWCAASRPRTASDAAAAAQAAARARSAAGLVAEEDAVFLNDLLDLPQPTELRALYDAMDNADAQPGQAARRWRGWSSGRAGARPRLLVVEDLHWADAADPGASGQARRRRSAACPALLVMTSRVEGDPLGPGLARAARRRPADDHRSRPAAAGGGAALAGAFLAATARLRRALRRARRGQPAVPRAAAAPRRGERRGRRAGLGAEPRAGAPRPARPGGQAGAPGGLRARPALRADALRHLLGEPDYARRGSSRASWSGPQGEELPVRARADPRRRLRLAAAGRRRELHRRAAEWFARARSRAARRASGSGGGSRRRRAPTSRRPASQAADYRYELALRLVERGLALADRAGRPLRPDLPARARSCTTWARCRSRAARLRGGARGGGGRRASAATPGSGSPR